MVIYIDDILLMAESAEQVTLHLEALLYLLTGLGFIINVPKSMKIPSQQIEFLGLLVDSITSQLSLLGEKLHHIRLVVTEERSGDSTPTGSNNRETKCDIPSSPPSSPVLSFPSREFTEGTEQQQSRLYCIHNPVPSSQGRTAVVAGENRSME